MSDTLQSSAAPLVAAQLDRRRILEIVGQVAPIAFLLVLILVFGLANERFFATRNIFNILNEVSIYGLMAVGVTFVILAAGIDLSVGSMLALSAMVSAVVVTGSASNSLDLAGGGTGGYGWFAALVAAVLVGSLCGFLQGAAIAFLRVPAFVVTLGGMSAFRGATLVISGGGPIPTPDPALRWFGQTRLFEIVPVPVLFFLAAAMLGAYALHYTKFGRNVYAVGGNPEAARLAGVKVDRTIVSVYLVSGLLAGLAGFLLNARLGAAEAVAGQGFELRVIASVVIGGTSLFGGIGGISGTVVGALLIGVLMNGLVMLNVNVYWQQIIVGAIIVLAVALNIAAKGGKRRG